MKQALLNVITSPRRVALIVVLSQVIAMLQALV